MSHTPANPSGSLSLWWILLLVPVALPIGWLVGRLEGSNPRAPKAAASQVANTTATPEASPRPIASTSPAGGGVSLWSPEPEPTAAPPPAEKAPPAIVSQWTDLESALSESQRNGKPVLMRPVVE